MIRQATNAKVSYATVLVSVQRGKNEFRSRPNAWKRQDGEQKNKKSDELDDSLAGNAMDIEWLAMKWREYRAVKAQRSYRRKILVLLEEDYQYFPSLNQIMNGIIYSQKQQLPDDCTKECTTAHTKMWKNLFKIGNLGNFDQPLTAKILSNPNHKIVMHLMYIFSMESFLFSELNLATREKNSLKIKHYGPIASAVGYIVQRASMTKEDQQPEGQVIYRGLKR